MNALLQCPVCLRVVRSDRLKKHIRKVHSGSDEASPQKQSGDDPNRPLPSSQMVNCLVCGTQVSERNLHKHIRKVHSAKQGQSAALPNKAPIPVKFSASAIDKCGVCGRRVAFKLVSGDKYKAYDFDSTRTERGPHVCGDMRGESIFAYHGGVPDSNRRRH